MFGKIFHFKKRVPTIYAAVAKKAGTFELNGNVIGYKEDDVVFFDGPGPTAKPIDLADNGAEFVATHEASIVIPVAPGVKKKKTPSPAPPKAPSKQSKKNAAKAKAAAKKKKGK